MTPCSLNTVMGSWNAGVVVVVGAAGVVGGGVVGTAAAAAAAAVVGVANGVLGTVVVVV